MKHYEIKITLLLNKDIKYENIYECLASNINQGLYEDEVLSQIHLNKKYKPYVVGNLYPFDMQSKIYKANQVYVLSIRSIDKDFLNRLKNSLKKSTKLDFKVLAVEFKELKYGFIHSVYTLTPTIISITDDYEVVSANEQNRKIKYWTKEEGSLDFVKKRIKDNLEKKYFEFFNEKLVAPDDFIQMIQVENKKPIVFNYKGSKLFTNKFKLMINSDEVSQKLIKLAFCVGLLEKNSLGFGLLTRGK